jgi:hypothetical protein
MLKNNLFLDAVEDHNKVIEHVDIVPAIIVNCRQTIKNISFYLIPPNSPLNEVEIKKLDNLEFLLRICYAKAEEIITYIIKLANDVEWPPKWQKKNDMEVIFYFSM